MNCSSMKRRQVAYILSHNELTPVTPYFICVFEYELKYFGTFSLSLFNNNLLLTQAVCFTKL